MTQPLAGLTVIVTRPARQAARLIAQLDRHGAAAVAFPTIAIEPVTLAESERTALRPGNFDWIVYTSANAVEHSIPQIGKPDDGAAGGRGQAQAKVAAIGRATARALAEAGIAVDAVPFASTDSEGLLALPQFAEPRGLRVLIVKGAAGRDALRTGLDARGARVATAEVYRRVRASPSVDEYAALDGAGVAGGMVAVAATSAEVLEALLELLPESRAPWLRNLPLLVPSERVAACAGRAGWRGPLIVAPGAEDDAMTQALVDWLGSARPAAGAHPSA